VTRGPFPGVRARSSLVAAGGPRALKAIYQIPLCVSLVFLVVQGLRVSLNELLDYVIRNCKDEPEQRW
jgi:hypothetical protein